MNKITKGERYTTGRFYSGESSKGNWEMYKIVDDKGKNEVTVFPSNIPTGGRDNCDIVIKDILEVRVGFRQSKKDQKWYPETNITAEIEVIKSDIDVDFDVDEGELPWNEGDMMDDIGLPL